MTDAEKTLFYNLYGATPIELDAMQETFSPIPIAADLCECGAHKTFKALRGSSLHSNYCPWAKT